MKRFGVLTFITSDQNYGAVLQAADLREMIKELGNFSEHILVNLKRYEWKFLRKK